MTDVYRPLIDVHRRSRGTAGQPRRRSRNQRQQLENGRIGDRRSLRVSGNCHSWQCQTLALAKPFITKEEKTFVLAVVAERRAAFAEVRQVDRTADIRAKLITFERRPSLVLASCDSRRTKVEEVASIEGVVAQELKQFAVIIITSTACGNVDDSSGITAVFGAESRIVGLKLLHSVDGWLKGDLVLHHVVEIDAVDHEVHGVFPPARGVQPERSLAAKRRREKSVLWRRHRARNQ